MNEDDKQPATNATVDTPPSQPVGPTDTDASSQIVQEVMNSDWGKKLSNTLDKVAAFIEKAAPIFEQIEQEAAAEQSGAGKPPGAAEPSGYAPPQSGAGGGEEAESPAPDREGPPDKKNSTGSSFGYGNTYMPRQTFARGDYETRIAMDRNQHENEQLRVQFAAQQREIAAFKLERIEAEVDQALSRLASEGYTVVRDVDRVHLCRLDKDARNKAVKFMRATRAKTEGSPPGGGRYPIDPTDTLQPVKFERSQGEMMPGDPTLQPGTSVPDDYDALVKMAGQGRAQGINLKNIFDAPLLPQQNGVKVR